MSWLFTSEFKVKGIVIGAVIDGTFDKIENCGRFRSLEWQAPSYCTHLTKNFSNIDCFLESLSSNSRAQIRKSMRLYEKIGKLTIDLAKNSDELSQWFEHLNQLHMKRWGNSDEGSGFSNPWFVSFHSALLNDGLKGGEAELLRIKAGDSVLGYLYNFVFKGHIYFYLSGFNFNDDPKLKPGLVSHCLAISYYSQLGNNCYDFMGGDARYKRSLSNQNGEMTIIRYNNASGYAELIGGKILNRASKYLRSLASKESQ